MTRTFGIQQRWIEEEDTGMRAYRKWRPNEPYIETIKDLNKTDSPLAKSNPKRDKTQINTTGDEKVSVATDPYEIQRIQRERFENYIKKKKPRKSRRNGSIPRYIQPTKIKSRRGKELK